MSIAANAPMLSDAPTLIDTTNTNLLLLAILHAFDPQAASMIPDDVVTSVVGAEVLT